MVTSLRRAVSGMTAIFLTTASVVLLTQLSAGASSNNSPVTVSVISQETNPAFSAPESAGAAAATVKSINEQGGLGGHPVKLITCDDKGDATTGANCARTAVQDNAVAVVEGISLEGATILPVLNASKIPAILSPVVPADFTNTDAYLKDGGTVALWSSLGIILAKSGCQKIAVLYDSVNPGSTPAPAEVTAALQTLGGSAKVVASIGVPESSPNLTAAIGEVTSAGADCMAWALTPTQGVAAYQAVKQSSDPSIKIAVIGPDFPNAVAQQLGSLAKNTLVTNFQYLPGSRQAADFVSVMNKGGEKIQSSYAQNVYIGFKILQSALKGHSGPLTAATVTKALNSDSSISAPSLPTAIQFHKFASDTTFHRISNFSIVGYQFNGSTFVALTGPRGVMNTEKAVAKYVQNLG